MKLGLEGRRALVTGGSKGLGAAIARELVSEGVRVAICARNGDEVLAAAEELRSSGGVYDAIRESKDLGEETVAKLDDALAKFVEGFDIVEEKGLVG